MEKENLDILKTIEQEMDTDMFLYRDSLRNSVGIQHIGVKLHQLIYPSCI